MNKFLSTIFISSLVITGCASNPPTTTDTEKPIVSKPKEASQLIDKTDKKPNAEKSKDFIKKYMNSTLKDPYSAKIDIRDAEITTCSTGLFGAKQLKAWGFPTLVNAKNSYGAYVGTKVYIFYFYGDDLIGMTTPEIAPMCSYVEEKK